MLVDTIGLGIIIPVTPRLIAELTGEGISEAARWGGWLFFVYALMQFIFAPVIGNVSDRFGRRPVLILSLLAIAFDYALTGFAPTIGWLFFARLLSGAAGATYSTVNAYIADVSPPEKRAANFGLTGAAFGIGFVLGPALGGLIGEFFGPRMPFFAAAFLSLANAAYGTFVLAESLPSEKRRKFEIWRANPLGALIALKTTPAILALMGVVVLMRLAHDSLPATWTYYTIEKFQWSSADIGLSLAAVGILTAIVFGFLTRLVVPRLGEKRAVQLGLSCAALGFAGYALATRSWMMFAIMPVWALGGLATPALNAIMSRGVGDTEQGALQGAIASVGSLTSILAPVLMTSLFAFFTSSTAPIYFAGAAFLAAALFELAAAGIFTRMHLADRK
jgi:DHA1 family tetracycline resistance protein-like MFS transporter